MLRKLTGLITGILFILAAHAQENSANQENKPEAVRDIFAASTITDNQTVVSPMKGAKELLIQHRFSKIDNYHDLYGFYGASNVRLAFQYGITNRLMVGFGTEKDNKMQELYWKYAIIQQKTKGMPFSLSYFGNACIDGRNKDMFGPDYKFTNRLSYFTEFILSRKFTDRLSLEAAACYSHFNAMDSNYQNDSWGFTVGGRFKVHNEISLIGEYDYAHWLNYAKIYQITPTDFRPQPNYAIGFEIGTSTHAFQVFATTYNHLNPQENFTLNQKKSKDMMLAFNITIRL